MIKIRGLTFILNKIIHFHTGKSIYMFIYNYYLIDIQ